MINVFFDSFPTLVRFEFQHKSGFIKTDPLPADSTLHNGGSDLLFAWPRLMTNAHIGDATSTDAIHTVFQKKTATLFLVIKQINDKKLQFIYCVNSHGSTTAKIIKNDTTHHHVV